MRQLSAQLCLRPYTEEDLCRILALFYDTVHSINLTDYTKAQADAWAPKEPDILRWQRLLKEEETWVAVQDGIIVGFANLDGNYFDCLYVHKDCQRRGIASALAEIIERRAAETGQLRLHADASITARPFFEKRGYAVVRRQCVYRAGQQLINFAMERLLKK